VKAFCLDQVDLDPLDHWVLLHQDLVEGENPQAVGASCLDLLAVGASDLVLWVAGVLEVGASYLDHRD
jgi:hypothetical protein